MTAEVVVVGSKSTPEQVIARLREMGTWIASISDVDDLLAAHKQIHMAREWARIQKVANSLRIEAVRIEAVALRRLGQIGYPSGTLRGSTAVAADGFAKMSDADFDELLSKAPDGLYSPVQIWNIETKRRGYRSRYELGVSIASGSMSMPGGDQYPADPSDVARAAGVILSAMSSEGTAFTIAETTDRLLEWFAEEGGAPSFIGDSKFREGMSDVMRRAVRAEQESSSIPGIPSFITYLDGDVGYVRIPWRNASVDQLKAMARLRTAQASQMSDAAGELERIVSDVVKELNRKELPSDARLSEIVGIGDQTIGCAA